MPVVPPNIISNGVDLSVHGDGATFVRNNKLFVVRYLSPNTTNNPQKKLTLAEIDDYRLHELLMCVVWETFTSRARAGYTAGQTDATLSQRALVDLHLPVNMPVYFAIDEDTTGPAVNDYFRGCGDTIGVSRVGAYGGIRPLSWLFDNHRITYGWQTFAWSNGKLDSRCQAYQHQNNVNVGGYTCDLNYQLANDFGQMNPDGTLGDTGVDMDLTPQNLSDIGTAVWKTLVQNNVLGSNGQPIGLVEANKFLTSLNSQVNKLAANGGVADQTLTAVNALPSADDIAEAVVAKLPQNPGGTYTVDDIVTAVMDAFGGANIKTTVTVG